VSPRLTPGTALLAVLLLLACATTQAQTAARPAPEGVHVPAWKELSREQQADLGNFPAPRDPPWGPRPKSPPGV